MKSPFILLASLLLGFANLVSSQTMINGAVLDEQSRGIPYANVIAIRLPDSIFHKGAAADELGHFNLKLNANFSGFIKANSIGFSESIQLFEQSKSEYRFVLNEQASSLDEIRINAKLPLFEKKADRLVVNIQNAVTSAGGTALEILEKSPGVGIDRQNGTISLNGKSGVMIMINGKLSRMPADAVIQMLTGISSETIENIELITNPPAKYEASGSALINVNLLESEFYGTSGNYGGHVAYNEDFGYGLTFNLNNRSGKWNNFIGYNGNLSQNNQLWFQRNEILQNNIILVNESLIDRDVSQNNHSIRLGTSYQLGESTDINILVSGYRNQFEIRRGKNNGSLGITSDSTVIFRGDIKEKNLWKNGIISFGLDQRFREHSSLSFNVDYLTYVNNQPASFDNDFFSSESKDLIQEEFIETSKKTPLKIWVGKIDYSSILNEKMTWEAGTKLSLSNFENDFKVEQTQNGILVDGNELNSLLILDENVFAGYLSTEWSGNDKWTITGGLRYEHTLTQLGAPGKTLEVDRKYGNFFPNLTLTHSISDRQNLTFSYGKRINRPNFNDLAPFTFFQSPNTLVSGNANLRPAITENLEISYQWREWWLSLTYSDTRNQIAAFQPELDEESGLQLLRSQNLEYVKSNGLQLSLPLKSLDWLDFQNTISLSLITINPKRNGKEDVFKNLNFTYQGTATFNLPKNFWFEISANYQSSPSWWGVTDLSSLFRMDIGVKKKLGENGGILSLVFNDIFDSYKWQWENAKGSITDFDFSGYFQSGLKGVRISYTHSFGNSKLKEVTIDSGSEDEQGRVQ